MKFKHRIISIIVATTICLIIIYISVLSYRNTQNIYLQQTVQTIINLKKDNLKDTVNNIFLEIESLRNTKYNYYKNNTEARQRRLHDEMDLTDEEFVAFFKEKFDDDLNVLMWTAFLWDNETGEIIYDSTRLNNGEIEITVENLKNSLSSFATINKGNIEGIFGISKAYIDEIVKKDIEELIRRKEFSNGSYIWVNEIINYEGGENYAIRRVHPNLKETEGMYLSTDMEDIKGNRPYLEELEGIKKDGEIFFTYYFKKLNSSQISEKITYAKLYGEYDWIIAMGVHLDDVNDYIEQVNSEISKLTTEVIEKLLVRIVVVLLIGFVIMFFLEKKHILISTKNLEREINLDTLTKSSSRRYGEINFNAFFKQYKIINDSPAIMMLDIDNYKSINDSYGHQVGDIVLTEIVKTIYHIIRSSDVLIRWGGDEFVGIFPGLRAEHLEEFGQKLLSEISSLKIPVDSGTITITASIGFSYFKETDNDYKDVLKRADDALYMSKEQGKNRVNILL